MPGVGGKISEREAAASGSLSQTGEAAREGERLAARRLTRRRAQRGLWVLFLRLPAGGI
ncbi:hypothetical protein K3G39_20250 [Pontibacter sp. HSC-14F20]|uniref:hypothetical protein n=1 Tax=Pontibacter sp. HSC-14F20 TaxID=2864136 RepID=UPI001C738839|nr:hypothetical protein [Pontibacter sp. HSC-14F20]MBX0335570.1 hypothetical protein [Pontibacter sp. HSC-14F20]